MEKVIKISSKSNPNSVAGMIAYIINNNDICEIHCIGAGAINQAIKGMIIAKSFLSPIGKNITFDPSFGSTKIGKDNITMINFVIKVNK